jgi:hypothetical protein
VLDRCLEAHPADAPVLLAALYGVYAQHLGAAAPERLESDRARARQWAATYKRDGGDRAGLVDAWLGYLESLR